MPRYLISRAEVLIILLLACVPLFIHLPYRVNIFLSWEGAYRMSQGQLPFRDFGTPLGGMYWVIPAIFFKVFGPKTDHAGEGAGLYQYYRRAFFPIHS